MDYLKIIIPIALCFLMLSDRALSKEQNEGKKRTSRTASQDKVTFSQFDVNNIATWLSTNGQIVSHIPTGGSSGLEWPKGSGKEAIFASGLWVIGKIDGEIRSAVAEFSTEFVAGPFGSDPTSSRNKIFRVSPNFPDGLDINGDGDFDDTFDDLRNTGISSETGEFDPWSAWPAENGAPVNANGDPDISGDSMVWMVFNDGDPEGHRNLWATEPLGLEVQASMFGFRGPGREHFENIMFVKWLIINRGGNTIDSTFVAIWSDPDVGTAGDDLVGVDTTLSIGIGYNGTAINSVYGSRPPAVGYDLLQGPIVPATGETAFSFGREIRDFRNLPLTSFSKYIGGGPIEFEDPESAPEAFNYLRGKDKLGRPLVDPTTNNATAFANSGDPVTQTGWLDSNPGDRRFLMSSGPFTMTPGDSQEVVAAVIIAQGADHLDSITELRFLDLFAKSAYFNRLKLPQAPIVQFDFEELNREVLLTWGESRETVESIDTGGYRFEGYNVYQGGSLEGPWQRIATFDRQNDIRAVFDIFREPQTGEIDEQPVAFGKDTGIQRFLRVTEDALEDDARLINNRRYYFAVTAYFVNLESLPKVIESPIVGKLAMPHEPDLGDELNTEAGEALEVTHTMGRSDTEVMVQVINPQEITGDAYRITFNENQSWDLFNTTENTVVLQDQTDISGGRTNDIADGLLVTIDGHFDAPVTFSDARQTRNIEHPDRLFLGGDATDLNKETGRVREFFGRGSTDPVQLGLDLELRFTGLTDDGTVQGAVMEGGQIGTQFERAVLQLDTTSQNSLVDFQHTPVQVPFELWDIENDRQVNVVVINVNADDAAPYGDGIGDGDTPGQAPRWRITGGDYIIPVMSDYDPEREFGLEDTDATWLLFFRQGGEALWSTGDEFLIEYDNPLVPGEDEYEFDTPANVRGDRELALSQIDKINVFPNPYRGSNIEERDPINRFVRFTHLEGEVTIRIFTISGTIVRVLEHDGRSQFCEWDLRNERGIAVASGMYLALLDLKTLGAQKLLKLAIIQPSERPEVLFLK